MFHIVLSAKKHVVISDISRNHQSTDVTTGEITTSFLKDKTTSYFTFRQTGTSVLSKKKMYVIFSLLKIDIWHHVSCIMTGQPNLVCSCRPYNVVFYAESNTIIAFTPNYITLLN